MKYRIKKKWNKVQTQKLSPYHDDDDDKKKLEKLPTTMIQQS